MRRLFLFTTTWALPFFHLLAQVTMTAGDATYTQDFNSLANTGTSNTWTDNTTITGWYSDETTYRAGTGSDTNGALYSFGSSSDTDRSLGSLASSGTATVYFGIRILNNTGATITNFDVNYIGEQWRQTTAAANTLAVSFQVGATDLTSGSWTTVSEMDFTSPQSGTTGSLDGNAEANWENISGTIITSVADGQEIWIRWVDVNNAGSDHGLGIDDFSITGCGTGEPTNHATSFSQSNLTNSTITLTWTDATGGTIPNAYLIKGSTVGYGDITDPSDATLESDGELVRNVDAETQTASFEDLTPNTTYYFQLYPYTCTSPDYKIDGTIPQVSFTTSNYPVAWINEIHYDNSGVDANEVIEVAIKDPGSFDLSLLSVVLYNGGDQTAYDTRTVSTDYTTGSTSDDITLYYLNYTPLGGIQNDMEGIALDYNGNLIQFLSYEGSFTGSGGVADGVASTDIGVSESTPPAAGLSMQLIGSGNSYDDFTWTEDVSSTTGSTNGSQTLPVELISFSGKANHNIATLEWVTASEKNNHGFEIYKSPTGLDFELIGFIKGKGNSGELIHYSFIDDQFQTSSFYQLKQIDFDGKFSFSQTIFIESQWSSEEIRLFPNPISNQSILELRDINIGSIDIVIHNLAGTRMNTISKWDSTEQFNHFIRNLKKGLYMIRLQIDGHEITTIKAIKN